MIIYYPLRIRYNELLPLSLPLPLRGGGGGGIGNTMVYGNFRLNNYIP